MDLPPPLLPDRSGLIVSTSRMPFSLSPMDDKDMPSWPSPPTCVCLNMEEDPEDGPDPDEVCGWNGLPSVALCKMRALERGGPMSCEKRKTERKSRAISKARLERNEKNKTPRYPYDRKS